MKNSNLVNDFTCLTSTEIIDLNGGDNVTQWLFYKAGQLYQSVANEVAKNNHPPEYYK